MTNGFFVLDSPRETQMTNVFFVLDSSRETQMTNGFFVLDIPRETRTRNEIFVLDSPRKNTFLQAQLVLLKRLDKENVCWPIKSLLTVFCEPASQRYL